MYISVVLSNDSSIALSFLSSASTFGRKHCACATAYLMCLRCFIHTNCTSMCRQALSLHLHNHTLYFSFCPVESYINLTHYFYMRLFQERYNKYITCTLFYLFTVRNIAISLGFTVYFF